MSNTEYDAFICYRRSDGGRVARWLRRALQGFQPPAWLKVYLDTAYERGASDFYEQNIKPALLASRYLLVVATPGAVRRAGGVDDWMLREVSDFSQGPNRDNVIAVRAAGGFNDPLPADIAQRFPNIEIVDLRGAGRFSFLNPIRTTKLAAEKLKIIAALVDLAPNEMPLIRREEERRQSRFGAAAGISFGVLVAISLLSIFLLRSQFRATQTFEASMRSAGIIVRNVAVGLSRAGSDESLRTNLLTQGCNLIAKLKLDIDREARIGELVTCRVERGYGYELLAAQNAARASFQEAIDLASVNHQGHGGAGVDAALALIEARKEMAAYLKRQKDIDGADAELLRLLADGQRFGKMHENRYEFATAEGKALEQRGDILLDRGDKDGAGRNYDAAAEAAERAVTLSFRDPPSQIEWLVRLYNLAAAQRRALNDREGALLRFARARDVRTKVDDLRITPGIDLEAAFAAAFASDLQRQLGNDDDATKLHREAIAGIARVMISKDASYDQRQQAQSLQARLQARADSTPR